jgi:hypothetical protein
MARARASSSGEVTALVIFVDIRGFTSWSDTPEVFSNLDTFTVRFNEIIGEHLPNADLVKSLGLVFRTPKPLRPSCGAGFR